MPSNGWSGDSRHALIQMPIPTTRAQLVDQASRAFAKLTDELRKAGPEIATLVCVDDWSVKDVLAVRVWWSHAVIDWVDAGKQGRTLFLPAPGYAWNETPRLNADIVAAASGDTYASILDRLDEGFERVIPCVDSLNDTELLTSGAFAWAGKWPIARWISINTTRQYTTARTYIRKLLRDVR